ncbi:MAG: hypothetical protein JWQ38_1512 [Flavipsychrobacter sp.]|nr:hypothetical protein [Flavipsychrobacter sp.]
MFEIALLAYLAYRNSVKAKLKGLNPALWGFITVAAYLSCVVIGLMVVIYNCCKDTIDMNAFSSSDIKTREVATQQLMQVLSGNMLYVTAIELFGIGGYLLVRYILDSKPDKKEPEVHWMDKLGGGTDE